MNEGEQWKKDQLTGFVRDIWTELTEEDIAGLVGEMRECHGGYYARAIPAEWRPTSPEQYIEMMKNWKEYN